MKEKENMIYSQPRHAFHPSQDLPFRGLLQAMGWGLGAALTLGTASAWAQGLNAGPARLVAPQSPQSSAAPSNAAQASKSETSLQSVKPTDFAKTELEFYARPVIKNNDVESSGAYGFRAVSQFSNYIVGLGFVLDSSVRTEKIEKLDVKPAGSLKTGLLMGWGDTHGVPMRLSVLGYPTGVDSQRGAQGSANATFAYQYSGKSFAIRSGLGMGYEYLTSKGYAYKYTDESKTTEVGISNILGGTGLFVGGEWSPHRLFSLESQVGYKWVVQTKQKPELKEPGKVSRINNERTLGGAAASFNAKYLFSPGYSFGVGALYGGMPLSEATLRGRDTWTTYTMAVQSTVSAQF